MLRSWHGCDRQRSQQHQLQGQGLPNSRRSKVKHRGCILPNPAKLIGYPGGPQVGQIWVDHPSEMMSVIDYCDKWRARREPSRSPH